MLFHDFLNYENILVLTQRGMTTQSVCKGECFLVLFGDIVIIIENF